MEDEIATIAEHIDLHKKPEAIHIYSLLFFFEVIGPDIDSMEHEVDVMEPDIAAKPEHQEQIDPEELTTLKTDTLVEHLHSAIGDVEVDIATDHS